MFFLLRCGLCLGVVYAAIIASQGSSAWRSSRTDAVHLARDSAQSLVETASAGATAFCARHADECLADAGRLTALFQAAEPETAAADLLAAHGDLALRDVDVPLPVPDPRRSRRDAKLTQAY